ncbi:hypothetical protein JCGZ_14310 [Jatropha curcas]|uniref:C2 domain-containing protein n=1 Tax=Jatropha curcas TaxID=180498 RepID=A0A067K9P4_JATCU|nr:hypothetical protein JCGZ_14310 [Jatropha curcas]
MSSHPSGRSRLLEVKLRSADLNTNKNDKFYVNLWIHPKGKLQTKITKTRTATKPVWEEKFVFSVSENFLHPANTTILFFEIYRSRKIFYDSLVGSGQCHLKTLFSQEAVGKDVVYDADDDEEDDPRYSIAFESNEDRNIVLAQEKHQPSELKTSASVQVSKGLVSTGTLSFDLVVWKGYIETVGGIKWRCLAMPYDDFMLYNINQTTEKKRKGNRLFFSN